MRRCKLIKTMGFIKLKHCVRNRSVYEFATSQNLLKGVDLEKVFKRWGKTDVSAQRHKKVYNRGDPSSEVH